MFLIKWTTNVWAYYRITVLKLVHPVNHSLCLQGLEQHGVPTASQTPVEVEGQGLAEVKLLVQQKQAVERELWELKAQLEKAGFTSFSQMRCV